MDYQFLQYCVNVRIILPYFRKMLGCLVIFLCINRLYLLRGPGFVLAIYIQALDSLDKEKNKPIKIL